MEDHHLNERQREEIALQVDTFVRVLADRYGVQPADVVDTVKWVKERRETDRRLHSAAVVALVGILISAACIALWEGFKAALARGG